MTLATLSPPSSGISPMFCFDSTRFLYDPYPIGLAKHVLPDDYYDSLLSNWPPLELFQFKERLGRKYSLSERNNPEAFHKFVIGSQPWHELYTRIKDPGFILDILAMLRGHQIDLGLETPFAHQLKGPSGWRRVPAQLLRKFGKHHTDLKARFEFSMLPADDGHLLPHTDTRRKIVTLVVSMVREGEWTRSWGGGTAVLKPKDMRKNYNYLNDQLGFEEVETITTFDFAPNQCVIFVKTFNSLHGVYPMTGAGTDAVRKTLTINIEQV